MSGNSNEKVNNKDAGVTNKDTDASGGAAGGRPEKPDDEKSEKTMRNLESQS